MKLILKLFCSILFLQLTQSVLAQTQSELNKYNNIVESLVQNISSKGDINTYRKIGSRRFVVKGTFNNEEMRFKNKIKFYKSGLKREKIKIHKIARPNILTAKIVILNGKIYFAKYYETKPIGNDINIKEYEIILFNQENYRKTYCKNIQ
ncbi:MAG: hypothetical protein AB7S48_16880 [Bacteroidales bacterium]